MWFTGYDGSNYRIFYATSAEGASWTVQNGKQPVVDIDQEGVWDTNYAGFPTIIKEGDLFRMWFQAYNGSTHRILYTVSRDGLTWATPVQFLDKNQEGNWDTNHVYAPSTWVDSGVLKLWYCGNESRFLYVDNSVAGTEVYVPLVDADGNFDPDGGAMAGYQAVFAVGGDKLWELLILQASIHETPGSPSFQAMTFDDNDEGRTAEWVPATEYDYFQLCALLFATAIGQAVKLRRLGAWYNRV